MPKAWKMAWIAVLLTLTFLVTSCGLTATETGQVPPPEAPAASRRPTDAPASTETPTPTPSPAPAELLVLHTNDNWGETEPCG
jgi:PBP1b-binding outer membrane lipoprotein LpoB